MQTRRIEAAEWQELRETRLAALGDSPEAFAATLADEGAYPDEKWRQQAVWLSEEADEACFVAEDGSGFGGMAIGFLEEDDPTSAGLVAMWVAPGMRGGGIGAALLDEVSRWARDAGATRLLLWVNEENLTARRLYERAGFVSTGEKKPIRSNPRATELRLALAL